MTLDKLMRDYSQQDPALWNVARVLGYESQEADLRVVYDMCRSLENRILAACVTPVLARRAWERRQMERQQGLAAAQEEDDDEEMGSSQDQAGSAAMEDDDDEDEEEEEEEEGRSDPDEDEEEEEDDDDEASLPRIRRSVPVLPHGGGSALRAGAEHLNAVRSLGMLLYYSIVEAQRRAVAAASRA